MRENSKDLRAVLHDYAREMLPHSLDIYINGLMADNTIYNTFLAAATEENQEEFNAS